MVKNSRKTGYVVAIGLVVLIVPLLLVSFVSPDVDDTLSVVQERALFRSAYPLLCMSVGLSVLLFTGHRHKRRSGRDAVYDLYRKVLIGFIALDMASFVWLIVFKETGFSSVFQMFLFLQVAILSLIRARLFSD